MKFYKKNISFYLSRLLLTAVISGFLFFISYKNYLLFHSIVELLAIIISVSVFMIVWNTRKMAKNDFLVFLGISFLFISFLDLVHMLSYSGMTIFSEKSANIPTQLWIAGRFMSSITFAAAILFIKRKLNYIATYVSFAIITTLIILSIFYFKIFPDAFIEGYGLTQFKIIGEYVIVAIFLFTLILIYVKRDNFSPEVSLFLMISLGTMMVSEIMFTLYNTPYALFNLLGHIFRIFAFFFIYEAIVEIGLRRPYDFFFRRLNNSRKLLAVKTKELMTAKKEIESFSYSLSHDLRKELRLIDKYSAILSGELDRSSTENAEQYIGKIRNSIKEISTLIDSFIKLYSITKVKFKTEEINLTELIEQITSRKKDDYNIAVNIKIKSGMTVFSDNVLIKILFENLLDNAFKFIKNDGKAKIEAGSLKQKNNTVYYIRDNGIGIDKIYYKKIFLPFISFGINKKYKSYGIGLSIVKKIIDLLNGKIWVESLQDKGTTFFIDLGGISNE